MQIQHPPSSGYTISFSTPPGALRCDVLPAQDALFGGRYESKGWDFPHSQQLSNYGADLIRHVHTPGSFIRLRRGLRCLYAGRNTNAKPNLNLRSGPWDEPKGVSRCPSPSLCHYRGKTFEVLHLNELTLFWHIFSIIINMNFSKKTSVCLVPAGARKYPRITLLTKFFERGRWRKKQQCLISTINSQWHHTAGEWLSQYRPGLRS